jgi:hypothetical protein
MGASNWVHLEDCTVLRTTEKAVQVEWQGEELWLPRSQVSEDEKYEAGDSGVTISVTEWLARQKGIEVD